jgi:gluconolactonase
MDVVVGDFSMPNGLCFSPDEKKFYVTDTGELGGPFKQTIIRVYDVADDGKLSNGRLLHDFKDVPQPTLPMTSVRMRTATSGRRAAGRRTTP